jgi:hypothetical protein
MALTGAGGGAAYRPREYQLEMLDASRKENIIVAVCLFTRVLITMKC